MKKFLTTALAIIALLVAVYFWVQKNRPEWIARWTLMEVPETVAPQEGVAVSFDAGDRSIFYAGAPVADGYPNPVTILQREGFVVAYDEKRANPAWVAYKITLDKWDEEWKRPSGFDVDEETRARISHDDYTHSGYDRGHMAPNEAISESYGRQAQLQTFMMSNVVPQRPNLNQGPWRELEERLVEYTHKAEGVWVITGPIYDDRVELLPSGRVEIPDAFFKVAIDEFDGRIRVLASIMPQEIARRADPWEWLVSVDQVEEGAGWDLLEGLPDDVEAEIEAIQTGAFE